MDFKELLDYCKAQAILNTLESNEVSVWRSICRSYSEKFSTPLHLCLDGTIPPEDIMLAEFENQLKDFDEETDAESILDQIYVLEDPEYEKQKQEELEEFIDEAEKQEEERVRLGKPIHKALKKEVTIEEPINQMPAGGSINLSYLENEENPLKKFER